MEPESDELPVMSIDVDIVSILIVFEQENAKLVVQLEELKRLSRLHEQVPHFLHDDSLIRYNEICISDALCSQFTGQCRVPGIC
jgi:hypothetical protein